MLGQEERQACRVRAEFAVRKAAAVKMEAAVMRARLCSAGGKDDKMRLLVVVEGGLADIFNSRG